MVILDTSVIIDHLRRPKSGSSVLLKVANKKPKEVLAISVVSVQELYEGKSTADEGKEQHLLATISPLRILPYSYEVAELAGKLARDLGRPIELADAAIAATAISHGASLLTLDLKDFQGIGGLDLLSIDAFA